MPDVPKIGASHFVLLHTGVMRGDGSWEEKWLEQAPAVEQDFKRGTPLCDLMKCTFRHEFEVYINNTHRMPADDPHHMSTGKDCNSSICPPEAPLAFDPMVFSRFENVFVCKKHY